MVSRLACRAIRTETVYGSFTVNAMTGEALLYFQRLVPGS
jgi:hypothetical protein